MTMQLPPAGWYPDNGGGGRLRYFNGSTWTDRTWAGQSQPPSQVQFGPGRRGLVWKFFMAYLLFAVAAVVLMGLFAIGWQMRNIYEYHAGTPTTATIDRCVSSGRSSTCYGTWSVGGRSQTGPINGASRSDAGSTMDVRVRGGTAYAASEQWVSYMTILFSTVFTALIVFGAWLRLRRMFGRRSRRTRG